MQAVLVLAIVAVSCSTTWAQNVVGAEALAVRPCHAGEVYKECGMGCDRRCGFSTLNVLCVHECVEGCFCDTDLVRNATGHCVTPQECDLQLLQSQLIVDNRTSTELPPAVPAVDPRCRDPRKEYKDCGSPCVPTCEQPDTKDVVCVDMCVKGCFCMDGYLTTADKACVRPFECAPVV